MATRRDEHGRPIYGPWKRFKKRFRRKKIKTSSDLRFYNEVLHAPYQHYGLWEDSDPRNLEGLRTAQIRYADTLCEWIPGGVKTILDSGCGVGAMSEELIRRGYEVEGLSPDPHQQEVYTERNGRPFHLTGFLDFEPTHEYDLVLMSESCQYVWIEYLFPALKRCVPTGWFLTADYFVPVKDGTEHTRSGHRTDAFLSEAERNGFVLERELDITEAVIPTLELGANFVDRYALPTLQIIQERFQERNPWLYKLGSALFAGKLARSLEHGRQSLDADLFRKHRRYMIYLFKSVPVEGLVPFDPKQMHGPGSREHSRRHARNTAGV